jgi:hypothetical protein
MRRTILALVLAAVLAPAAARAQTTPWGDPDLQGIWSNQTPVPLERPAVLANKPFFTKAEAAEVEKNSLATILQFVGGAIPTSGELNGIWLETAKGKVGRNLRTSQVADPPDGQIPYTKEGKTRWFATPSLEGEIMGRSLAAGGPVDRTLDERCITTGGIFVPNPFYNNYHQIVQAPGYVVLLTEMMHEQRVVPLDRRPHVGANIRQWLGDSRGWWEGKTLVVETTNFNDKRRFYGSTSALKLVERFTRTDNDTISYQLTVSDPNTFLKPWTVENNLWRSDEGIFEVACHEGNYGLANILSGARATERK